MASVPKEFLEFGAAAREKAQIDRFLGKYNLESMETEAGATDYSYIHPEKKCKVRLHINRANKEFSIQVDHTPESQEEDTEVEVESAYAETKLNTVDDCGPQKLSKIHVELSDTSKSIVLAEEKRIQNSLKPNKALEDNTIIPLGPLKGLGSKRLRLERRVIEQSK